ncbi:MAG TPA: 2-oxoacid:acceptor oxidoreductase subunit alpha [Methanoregula sp.]|nr:2-oxoacid:acceptor oxidoreductase subunit alpha [Methanoregula sp.]
MKNGEVSILVGGKAGEGISSAGQIVAHLLGQAGYRVHMYFDYPSLIKGGHNFAIVRAAEEKVGAVRKGVDFILALDQQTVDLHRPRLTQGGVVIFDTGTVKSSSGIGIPVKEILDAEKAPAVMGNSAFFGAFARAAGIGWESAETVLRKSMPKGTEQNLRVARRAYDMAEERLKIPGTGGACLPVMTGNEAIGIGLLEGGLQAYFAYPMSPTSNLLHFLAAYADELRIRVIQPESEIAVILMSLGCAFAGTPSAVGTSGGGFCLMTESLGLAGIAEIPIVIVLGQRTGPSTGLATYTAQADLHFAANAGQGEFPRFIVAPGDAGEARAWSREAMRLAWKYQVPSIVLADRIICEGLYSVDGLTAPAPGSGPLPADPAVRPYFRYAYTESGISPLRFPPVKGEVIRVNSHVHDPDGITTEHPATTRAMAEKRMKKGAGLLAEIEGMDPVKVAGDRTAGTAILCWGSTKGICEELGSAMGFRVVRPVVLQPFPEKTFAAAMAGVARFWMVEENETAQLGRLVREHGYVPAGTILKYDGRPFFVEELADELQKAIA